MSTDVRRMSCETNETQERLLKCLHEIDNLKDEINDRENDLDTWIDSLEELPEILDAFESEDIDGLHGKTVLDVGTDCVKPLFIALKFKPQKIVGISEELPSFAPDIEQKSKLLTETRVHFYSCSIFDEENLKKILQAEEVKKFDFVLISKTLHHLRSGKDCVASKRDPQHECREDEDSCIYEFEEDKIFKLLLRYGERVIVFEAFYPQDDDEDKVRGRGGHFIADEWKRIFQHLAEKYSVQLIKPKKYHLAKSKLDQVMSEFREVDFACFYVEAK